MLSEDVTMPGGVIHNGGGLAGVWAVENSRDALFEALRNRETFGTSGPRIVMRFFGGWGYPDDLCARADLVEVGYADGVPMGGDLTAAPEGQAPTFVVNVMRDPADWATPLQRVQIIKGWLDADGKQRERVYDVAGNADNGATVDLKTCQAKGAGADSLCGVFVDPDFDPAERAFYYARAVENPTCRWSTRVCLTLPEAERPETCTSGIVKPTIQERAWSSPIWYTP